MQSQDSTGPEFAHRHGKVDIIQTMSYYYKLALQMTSLSATGKHYNLLEKKEPSTLFSSHSTTGSISHIALLYGPFFITPGVGVSDWADEVLDSWEYRRS